MGPATVRIVETWNDHHILAASPYQSCANPENSARGTGRGGPDYFSHQCTLQMAVQYNRSVFLGKHN